jgi:hypothetical protein
MLNKVRAVPELAIIINVETKYISTLALLGTLRHLKIPTLMIDCESQDGSFEWFQSLQEKHDFQLTRAPRRPHGLALDWIFQNIEADSVLLVDSDMEIVTGEMFQLMRIRLQENNVYGAGYFQQGGWLETHYGTDQPLAPGIGFYKGRPWIPFAMFRVEPVRLVLSAGESFSHVLLLNDVPQLAILSRLFWRRFRFDIFRRWRLGMLDPVRREYEGHKPSYVFCDTGARVHAALSRKGLTFGDVGAAIPPWSIRHLQGVTRDRLQGPSTDACNATAIEPIVLKKLRTEYDLNF